MRVRVLLLAASACVLLSAPALAGSGIYIGGGLGFVSPSDSSFHAPSLSQFGKYSLKTTNSFVADVGYKFDSGIRLELEGQEAKFDGDKIVLHALTDLTSPLYGHISEATVYLNANYDFPVFLGWSGTVGAGVGSAWNDAHGSAFSGLSVVRGSDRAFAWQVGGGVIHRLLPNLDLQIDYRYQGVGSTTVTEKGVGDFDLGKIKTQMVTASVRLYLLP